MDTRSASVARRVVAALFLAVGLGGCVYAPPYAYDAGYPAYGYPAYGYPTYVGPPVTLDVGFGYYRGHHHGHGQHGWAHRGGRSHHGGWGHRRGRH